MVRYLVSRPADVPDRIVREVSRPLPSLSMPDRSNARPLMTFNDFMSRAMITNEYGGQRKLCLLIPAHNESLVIRSTIQSAINAGMSRLDIYVVDDGSTDNTAKRALELLSEFNVIRVERSGKGLAIQNAAWIFMLSKRYEWIHIADADGSFARNYFKEFESKLRNDRVAATGYLRSMPGSYIGKFRVFEYTLGMEVTRRVQTFFNTLQVIPGATSCIRSDIFEQLDFDGGTLTEDYDVTLQIHRLGLGKIQFIPSAVAYTQDPENFHDFMRQIERWYRGGIQCLIKHDIGQQLSRLDFYITYQIFQTFLFLGALFIVMPVVSLFMQSPIGYATLFIWDVATMFAMTVLIAAKARRWDILSAFPLLYALKWVNTYVFTKALLKVAFRRRRSILSPVNTWISPTRVIS